MVDMREAQLAYGRFFEQIESSTSLADFEAIFAPDATFEDPFQRVSGVVSIKSVFDHMFAALIEPRFAIDEVLTQGEIAYLRWSFTFRTTRLSTAPQRQIVGVSRVSFDPQSGRATEHIDYWDAAAGIYRHLPLIGRVIDAIGRRMAAPERGS